MFGYIQEEITLAFYSPTPLLHFNLRDLRFNELTSLSTTMNLDLFVMQSLHKSPYHAILTQKDEPLPPQSCPSKLQFLSRQVEDLKLSEIPQLLAEYKALAELMEQQKGDFIYLITATICFINVDHPQSGWKSA